MYLHMHRYSCNTMQTSPCEVDHVLFWPDHFTLNIWSRHSFIRMYGLTVNDYPFQTSLIQITFQDSNKIPWHLTFFVDRWVLLHILFLGVVYPLHGLWAEMQLLAGWMVCFWQHFGCPCSFWAGGNPDDETTMNQMRLRIHEYKTEGVQDRPWNLKVFTPFKISWDLSNLKKEIQLYFQ